MMCERHLQGECPNCGTENRRYFGKIFVVEGDKESATARCSNCDTTLEFRNSDREVSFWNDIRID